MVCTDMPNVDETLLQEIVRRILSVGTPLKIVLFGSHARGEARPNSDLDLLIVEEHSGQPRHRRAGPYRRALTDTHPRKDILVFTPAEIDEWANVPEAFITTALHQGRVLYERPY